MYVTVERHTPPWHTACNLGMWLCTCHCAPLITVPDHHNTLPKPHHKSPINKEPGSNAENGARQLPAAMCCTTSTTLVPLDHCAAAAIRFSTLVPLCLMRKPSEHPAPHSGSLFHINFGTPPETALLLCTYQ